MAHVELGGTVAGAATAVATLVMLIGLTAGPATAAEEPAPSTCTKDLIRSPLKEDLYAYFPARARAQGISGRSVMRCHVTLEGTLRDCAIIEENPPNEGFGEALLSLAPKFRVHGDKGLPICTDATITIPISWRLR
jgi:TonB family protein